MGVRSDICAYFKIPIEHVEEFKNKFKALLINIIDDKSHMSYLIKNFYQIEVTEPISVGFCYFDESIKFDFIENDLDTFFNFLKSFKFPIKFEAKELCTEFIQYGDDYFRFSNDDEDDTQLYINCTIEGIPETNEISLLNWLNS